MSMIDFKAPFFGSRCLLRHVDPYAQGDLMRVYLEEEANYTSLNSLSGPQTIAMGYLPTIFPFTVPLATLSFGLSRIIWLASILVGLSFTSFLCWRVAAEYAPILAGCLLGFMLANSELVAFIGNPSGLAISCCVIGVWCFIRTKYVPLGILCLAFGLMIKPHDVCFVWLYFLLARGLYRRRAMQTLLLTVGLSLPAVLWTSEVAPDWLVELHSTLRVLSAHGALNDPGPASGGAHRLGMMVNLQTAISFFRDDPHFYNFLTYAICGALLLLWMFATTRSRPSPDGTWLALAAISALTMLPIYHRQTDTKLLILSVPACAMLYAEKSRIGHLAFLVTAAAFVFNADFSWLIVFGAITHLNIPKTELFSQLVTAVQVLPAPLSLLTMGAFYLWVYIRRTSSRSVPENGIVERRLA